MISGSMSFLESKFVFMIKYTHHRELVKGYIIISSGALMRLKPRFDYIYSKRKQDTPEAVSIFHLNVLYCALCCEMYYI